MITMPEVTLKHLIDSILNRIVVDYRTNNDKTKTFLYKLLYGVQEGNYMFYDEAVAIINRSIDDPRKLDTRLLFDRERASLPTIHVTIPSDQPFSDGIGFDEGYVQPTVNAQDNPPLTMTTYYTRSYQSRFDLVITGSNTFEVVLIYYLLRCALINNVESLEANGFRNPKFPGGDVKINEQITPVSYLRILTIDSFYELTVPKFDNISIVNTLTFEEKAV
jgi:hypothetical protein